MNLNVSDEQLNKVISAAIIETLTPERKNELLSTAVAELLNPKVDGYYGSKKISPLQDVFNNCVRLVAVERARELLKSDSKVNEAIDALLRDAWKVAMEKDREKTVERMGDGIVSYLSNEDR